MNVQGLMVAVYFVALVLMSSGVVLLMVQFLKALTGLQGRSVMVVAALVGMAWGFLTLRLPALQMWPDLPAFVGGPLMGLVAGMAAVGGKALSAYAIEHSASANAAERVKAQAEAGQVFDAELMQRNWLDVFQQGLSTVASMQGQQQPQVQVQVNPQPVPAPASDQPVPVPMPDQQLAPVTVQVGGPAACPDQPAAPQPVPLPQVPVTYFEEVPAGLTPVTPATPPQQLAGLTYVTRTPVPFDDQ